MRLRQQKLLLRSTSLLVMAFAVFVLMYEVGQPNVAPEMSQAGPATRMKIASTSDPQTETPIQLNFDLLVTRRLQQRLYDPPPPPPKEVVKEPPPPLNIQLLGTIIDTGKPQAIIRNAQGSTSFRTVGQTVSDDYPNSSIETITASKIEVRREEHLDTVSIQ